MIATYIGSIFPKTLRRRCVRALALWLPLFFALSSEAALARAFVYKETPSTRFHHAYVGPSARLHRVGFVFHARPSPIRFASPLRPHRMVAYASTQRRFVRFAASRPTMAPQAPGASGSSVIADALRFLGAGNVTGMRGPWCADYASMILRRTGHRPLANRSVSGALAYGPRVRQPRPGDLVVINTRAGYAQHVGFFAGWRNGQMVMVSGNWGRRVAVSPISPRSVAAFIGV